MAPLEVFPTIFALIDSPTCINCMDPIKTAELITFKCKRLTEKHYVRVLKKVFVAIE